MMQAAKLPPAITVAVPAAFNKQPSGSGKISSAINDEAGSKHTAGDSFSQAFSKAFRQARNSASTSAPPHEPNAVKPTMDENQADELAATGMLSPALQALIDSLPQPDSAANATATSFNLTIDAGQQTDAAIINGLAGLAKAQPSATATDTATLTGSGIAPNIASVALSNTPRLPAADLSADSKDDSAANTVLPDFKLTDLPDHASLPVAAATVQNPVAAETLMNAAAIVNAQQTAGSPVPSAHIATRVGAAEWDKAFGQQLVWIVKSSSEGSSQTASLSLNPPELGPIRIVLQISDAQAYASFSSAQPEVRQAIESVLPKLREMLGESGLQLAQADINSGNPQQQDEAASHQLPHSQQTAAARSAALKESETQASTLATVSTLAGRALIDIFA